MCIIHFKQYFQITLSKTCVYFQVTLEKSLSLHLVIHTLAKVCIIKIFNLPSLLCFNLHANLTGKKTRVGSPSLLQRIFPTQGLNQGLLHCRRILYCLSHRGVPSSLVTTSLFSLSINLFPFCYVYFSRFHMQVLICSICLPLADLSH